MEKETVNHFQIRFAVASDVPIILELIRELAEYVRKPDDVVATEALLREWLFEKEKAEVLIGEWNGEAVAYALFFHSFSTFLGRAGIYLEDLYVRPAMRGQGIGKEMLRYVAGLTVERGCGRLEWSCRDWNTSSIAFYLSMGAEAMHGSTGYRLAGDTLLGAAKGKE